MEEPNEQSKSLHEAINRRILHLRGMNFNLKADKLQSALEIIKLYVPPSYLGGIPEPKNDMKVGFPPLASQDDAKYFLRDILGFEESQEFRNISLESLVLGFANWYYRGSGLANHVRVPSEKELETQE